MFIRGGDINMTSSSLSAHDVRAMIEGSCVNIETLLEEFNARGRAVFLPPRDGSVYAFVPLEPNGKPSTAWAASESPINVLIDANGELGLMIFPPGSEVIGLSQLNHKYGIEKALKYVLIDFLGAVESLKADRRQGGVVVEMIVSREPTKFPMCKQSFGTLPTSIAGCILSTVLEVPLRLLYEQEEERIVSSTFEEIPRIQ